MNNFERQRISRLSYMCMELRGVLDTLEYVEREIRLNNGANQSVIAAIKRLKKAIDDNEFEISNGGAR